MIQSPPRLARLLRWWRAPWWTLAIVTGAKSFFDNPILGSPRLNRAGLHVWRKRTAHALADRRRATLARHLPPELRAAFDRDGFIVVPDMFPPADFARLQADLLDTQLESRAHQQGDTITRRVAVGPTVRRRFPALAALLDSRRWNGIMAYVASSRSAPLYYIQTIAAGIADELPDPQQHLHSDTFHPSLKAFLFLTDVADDGRPLTYVAGSHRLSPERAAWERNKVVNIDIADRLSQRGSLRVETEELALLGLPLPTRFAVPANTLVVIDTSGFHARADSDHPTLRVELWAYSRRTPFLPWAGGHLMSWRPLALRRAIWLGSLVDRLAARGWMIQHWRPVGLRRPRDP
ncbi:MAG: phytanoyl-CoA dioxygenase family protein [Pseudomonadota bacterium]|nr:phytanoyl-CoA dioxygenase family protein [Pseudomonadota bacterium]